MTPKADKHTHINRCHIADLALDNPMTNGHTTSTDLLWSGLPMITFPKTQNMPSRVATSICFALGIGEEAVCDSYSQYQSKAKEYALGTNQQLSSNEREFYDKLPQATKDLHGSPKLKMFRRKIELNRLTQPLFQTEQWVKHLEIGLKEALRMYSMEGQKIEHIQVGSLIDNKSSF